MGENGSAARLVELEGVKKSFGSNVVLDGIDLSIARGEAIVIAGPSGSGKSTLLRCINGLETIDSGDLRFDGTSVAKAGKGIYELRANMGMVFQSFNLFPHKTVLDNITLGPTEVKNVSDDEARERALQLLERVGIPEKAESYPADLSGGQQQRVAIARALAMEPEVMLFDEVTSALDPELVKGVLNLMAALGRRGMTMLVVTHEMNFARKVADQVIFMDEGEVVEAGPPQELFDRPKSGRLQRFLSEVL